MVSDQSRLSDLSRNLPRLWDLEGGNQYCEDLLMVLSLNDFF
jgi:hypothetical protein